MSCGGGGIALNADPQQPDFSVIICTDNACGLLEPCLDSIRAQAGPDRVEVVVVNRGCTDGTAEMLSQKHPDARVVTLQRPFRFSAFNNAGIRESRGRFVVLLNNDTIIRNNIFDEIQKAMDADPVCGAAGCKLRNPDNSVEFSCRRFPDFSSALFSRYSLMTRMFPGNRYSSNYLMTDFDRESDRAVDWVSGACLVLRREVLDIVGLLDEGFIFFSEDVDLCMRVNQAGWKVKYLHRAEVTHCVGATRSRRPFRSHWIRAHAMARFFRKHYSRSILLVDSVVLLMIAVRAVGETFWEILLRGFGITRLPMTLEKLKR